MHITAWIEPPNSKSRTNLLLTATFIALQKLNPRPFMCLRNKGIPHSINVFTVSHLQYTAPVKRVKSRKRRRARRRGRTKAARRKEAAAAENREMTTVVQKAS